jgi:hypothetical protein
MFLRLKSYPCQEYGIQVALNMKLHYVEHCVRYGFDNVYGFQILSHLILFFADGIPPIFMLLLRWISTKQSIYQIIACF